MTPRPITHQPRPSFASVVGRAGPWPCELERFERIVPTGRDALYWGFRILRGGPWRVAWLPAYHCGAEVQAALAAGFEVAFYPVDHHLDPNPERLRGPVRERPGPIVIIHYFGHPSPALPAMAELCAAEAVPMVVDACHGPLGAGGDTGSYISGDVVAVSFRKVLGTLDGGALQVAWARVDALSGGPSDPLPPYGRRVVRPVLDSVRRTLGRCGGDWADTGRATGSADPDRAYGRRISWVSERALRRWNPARVVTKRRQHWTRLTTLMEDAEGFAPLLSSLRDDAVPLSLAIRVEEREALIRTLLKEGIDSYTFGRHAHPALPGEAAERAAPLREEILGLPVHHDLTTADVERMAEVLRRHLPHHSPPGSGPCAASRAI